MDEITESRHESLDVQGELIFHPRQQPRFLTEPRGPHFTDNGDRHLKTRSACRREHLAIALPRRVIDSVVTRGNASPLHREGNAIEADGLGGSKDCFVVIPEVITVSRRCNQTQSNGGGVTGGNTSGDVKAPFAGVAIDDTKEKGPRSHEG